MNNTLPQQQNRDSKQKIIKTEEIDIISEKDIMNNNKESYIVLENKLRSFQDFVNRYPYELIKNELHKRIVTYGLIAALIGTSTIGGYKLIDCIFTYYFNKQQEYDFNKFIDTVSGNEITSTIKNMAEDQIVSCINNAKKMVEQEEKMENMSIEIRKREMLTEDQLNLLIKKMNGDNPFDINISDRNTALSALYLEDAYSYPLKMLIVMIRENLDYEQLDEICACVVAESGPNFYYEGHRVASVMYNRAHCSRYIEKYGDSLYNQCIAYQQFIVYEKGHYKQYLGQIDLESYKGAIDMFYSREPSVDYLSFRSKDYDVKWKYEQFTEKGSKGNKFGIPILDSERVESPYVEIVENEIDIYNKKLLLKKNNNEE